MERRNETLNTDFILLGLFARKKHVIFLVFIILMIYTVALTANTGLILLIWLDPQLHIPMYFLLSHLEIMDLTLISSTVPMMANIFFSRRTNISHVACEISHHHEPENLHKDGSCLTSLVHITFTCGVRKIPHFLCEVMAILKFTCEDTSAYKKTVVITSIAVLLLPLSLILSSYTLIFLNVLQVNSPKGRNKALATYSSLLTVVSFYYGLAIVVYMRLSYYHRSQNRSDSFCAWCYPDFYDEPPHLQSEKQRSYGSIEENSGTGSDYKLKSKCILIITSRIIHHIRMSQDLEVKGK
ncbi:olfactory receptor 2M3-like [Sarcophilus harrisii]